MLGSRRASFGKRLENVPDYLDWYYRIFGDYEQLIEILKGTGEEFARDKFVEYIEREVDDSALADELDRYIQAAEKLKEDAYRELEQYEIAEGYPEWILTEAPLDEELGERLSATVELSPEATKALERLGVSAGVGIATGFIAKSLVKKVAGSAGKVTYAYYSDAKCAKSVKAADVKNAGTYYVKATVAADANHKTATSGAAKITINKATNKLSTKAKTTKKKPLSAKRGKEATFALSKYAAVTNPAKGTLSYKRASGNAKIKVNAKNGKITVAKGLAKGAYTVKVKVTSAATTNYKSANKTVALYVKVK